MSKEDFERCKHCFSWIFNEDKDALLDPKKELCDKCYVKLEDEHGQEEVTFILTLDYKVNRSSIEEMIEYLESFASYTDGVESYKLEFKLPKKK